MNNLVHIGSGLKKERKRGRPARLAMTRRRSWHCSSIFSYSNNTEFLFSA